MKEPESVADSPSEEELLSTPADPVLEEPVVEEITEAGEEFEVVSEVPEGLTGAVRVGLYSCATGCWTDFVVPPPQVAVISARFRFVIGTGASRYSGFVYRSGVYPGSRIAARYPYRLPATTKQIWGYWWKGEVPGEPVPAYYNYVNVRC